ncbi:MAG TPA: MaoC family dehydratase N-terminal domain-containing protein [Candidatus Acidoferrales bacterium]|nr:MaoC family dehydratase N-terminal domain-containing protein [Candidatus Acidoferrales bacterium]
MAIEFDRSIIGSEFDRTVFDPVTAEEAREYAAASTESSAAEGVTSPTFVVRLRGRRFMPANLPDLGRMGFDAGKDIEFGVAVRVGDVLTAVSTVHDIYEKTGRSGTMKFLVLRTTVTNQRAEQVAVIDQKMMFR